VVVPLRGHTHTALVGGGDHRGIVQVGLGDQAQRPAQLGGQVVHRVGQLGEQVSGGVVDERVHRVQAQGVQVEVGQPAQRVVDDEGAHLGAAGPVQVDRLTPRGLVRVGEVRAELRQVVPGGSEVVVDHVQADRQAQE